MQSTTIMEEHEESEYLEDSEDSEDSSDISDGQPECNYIYHDDLPILPTCYVYVAILPGDGVLKHWMLYIDAPTYTEKPIIHLVGSPDSYRVETRFLTDEDEDNFIDRVNLCDIPNRQGVYDAIINAGERARVNNQGPSYNSQVYILRLLRTLEKRRIVSNKDPKYKEAKKKLKRKQQRPNVMQ